MGEGFADREYGDSRELASRRLPEKATKLTMTSLNSFSSSSLMRDRKRAGPGDQSEVGLTDQSRSPHLCSFYEPGALNGVRRDWTI